MAGFDAATALESQGGGRYAGGLDPAWQIAGKPNGGYLLSVLGRAALAEVGAAYPHPLVASAHYVASPEPGPAELTVQVLRLGRRTAQARVSLSTAEGLCVDALVTCGHLDPAEPFFDGVEPAELPPEDDCPRLPVEGPGFEVPLMAVLAERLDPATMGWAVGKPSGRGELRGWLRFDDGREPDTLALLTVVDALPPATFDLGVTGWVPTLELSCHVRAVPAPGALVVRQRARHVAGGRVDEECDVWDSTGRLVATGHQLAGVRHP
jgi:acyl-coenzyme A thioesterase PaaI-like protein